MTIKDDLSNNDLIEESKSGVLPMICSETGSEDEPTTEIIYVASISGGADYLDDMPRRLTLVRKFADGREIRAEYTYQGREISIEPQFNHGGCT